MAGFDASGEGDGLKLNVMPMLDIFSILITFLLMSYSTDPVSYDISEGVELPESDTLIALDEIPTIAVSSKEIKINDKRVAPVVDGDVPEQYRAQGAIQPVFEALEEMAKSNARLRRRKGEELDKKKLSTLTMEMDKRHRFKLMKRIMLSAQQAEFVTFNLMVAKGE